MLKVSLLPASYRKKVVGSKKKEQIKKISLLALVVLFMFFVVILGTRQYVSSKYDDIRKLNAQAVAMFPVLESYQALFNEVEAQKELLALVSAKEPYAHSFVVSLGNIDFPGLWLKKISANDWFYSKQCVIEGKCLSYETLLEYIEKVKKIEGVLEVAIATFAYTNEKTDTGDRICDFSLTITCSGTGVKMETTTVAPPTSADAAQTGN